MRLGLVLAAAVFLSSHVAANALTVSSGVTITCGLLSTSIDSNQSRFPTEDGSLSLSVDGSYAYVSDTSSPTSIVFSLSETLAPPNLTTNATGTVDFTALPGTSYSISDVAPTFVPSAIATDSFSTELFDLTSSYYLYETGEGDSLTGLLTAGESYSFTGQAGLTAQTDPTLTSSSSIAFGPSVTPSATPEPSSLALLTTGLLAAAGTVRRRLGRS